MEKVFEAKQELLRVLGWSENPFVKDLRLENPEEFLKFYYPFESAGILRRLAFDAKACMLLGPKGVGKTSALHFVMYSLPQEEFVSMLFKQPPESLGELALEMGIGRRGIVSKIKSLFAPKKARGVTRSEIAARIKSMGRNVAFFLDEAHLLSNKEMYMELKYLLDDVPNLRMVLSALGQDAFPDSLVQLVGEGNVFTRNHFSAREMREIISHRIGAVGGRGIEPFDEDALEKVFSEQNLLSPRYVFDELNNHLADLALDPKRMDKLRMKMAVMREWEQQDDRRRAARQERKELETKKEQKKADLEEKYAHDPLIQSVIREERAAGAEPGKETAAEGGGIAESFKAEKAPVAAPAKSLSFLTTMHAEWWVQLSPSQQSIMSLLLSSPAGLTLAQIMSKTGLSQNTAFNALYQLRGDDKAELGRKPQVPFPLIAVNKQLAGNKKRNIYFANEKIRNLFTMT